MQDWYYFLFKSLEQFTVRGSEFSVWICNSIYMTFWKGQNYKEISYVIGCQGPRSGEWDWLLRVKKNLVEIIKIFCILRWWLHHCIYLAQSLNCAIYTVHLKNNEFDFVNDQSMWLVKNVVQLCLNNVLQLILLKNIQSWERSCRNKCFENMLDLK